MKVFYDDKQSVANNQSYSPSAGKPKQVVEDWLHRFPDFVEIESFRPATVDTLKLAHDADYIDAVLACEIGNGFGNKSPDVAASIPYTVGSLIAACRHAVDNRDVAFSPTSGFHHAGYSHGGGFCTVNGLVIAAIKMRRLGLVDYVLIIDGDAHYGDGTADCIQKTRASGWLKQITAGDGYSTAREFFDAIELKRIVEDHLPIADLPDRSLVIYQAGADAWEKDPLHCGKFTLKQLQQRDEQIIRLAHRYRVPLAINLAGGYSVDADGSIEPVLKIHRQTMQAAIKIVEGL